MKNIILPPGMKGRYRYLKPLYQKIKMINVHNQPFSTFDIKCFSPSDDLYFEGMELFAENLDKV